MSRIYKVKTPNGERLVDANTKGQAINHCVDADYSAEPVSASEMYDLIQKGMKVEKAETKGKSEAGDSKPQTVSTPPVASTPAPVASAPQSAANPSAGGKTEPNKAPAPFIPPAPATPGQFQPGVNPVLAEQQKINPNAAAAAGAPPLPPQAPVIPVGAAPAPAQSGPVDWDLREQGTGE